VGLKPMIPVFKQAKTVHALDRAANAITKTFFYGKELQSLLKQYKVSMK
jgi:hypothetical protein